MPGAGVHGVYPRSHRLHALARQRQHQPCAIAFQAVMAVSMPESLRQMLQVLVEPLACAHRQHLTQKMKMRA